MSELSKLGIFDISEGHGHRGFSIFVPYDTNVQAVLGRIDRIARANPPVEPEYRVQSFRDALNMHELDENTVMVKALRRMVEAMITETEAYAKRGKPFRCGKPAEKLKGFIAEEAVLAVGAAYGIPLASNPVTGGYDGGWDMTYKDTIKIDVKATMRHSFVDGRGNYSHRFQEHQLAPVNCGCDVYLLTSVSDKQDRTPIPCITVEVIGITTAEDVRRVSVYTPSGDRLSTGPNSSVRSFGGVFSFSYKDADRFGSVKHMADILEEHYRMSEPLPF